MDTGTSGPTSGNSDVLQDSSLEAPATTPVAATTPDYERPHNGIFSIKKRKKLLIINLCILLVIGLIGVASYLFFSNTAKEPISKSQKISNYKVAKVPVSNVKPNSLLKVGTADQLTINGQVSVGNTLILTPTGTPTTPVAGQIYYNQANNTPYYYNGTRFISLAPQPGSASVQGGVTSLGGSSGSISLGSGLALSGGQLGLRLQAGNGISISGSTVTNTGVVTLSPGSSNISITNNGNGSYSISDSTIGLISGTGTAGQLPLFTTGQSLGDSILSQSGSTITDTGALSVQGAASADSLSATNGISGGSLSVTGAANANSLNINTNKLTVDNNGNVAQAGTLAVNGGNLTINHDGGGNVTGISGTPSITANSIQSASGSNLIVSAGSNVISFYTAGIEFLLPTNGSTVQKICTSSTVGCAQGGGTAVILGPNQCDVNNMNCVTHVQSDNSANSIFIYNNNTSADLLHLQGGASSALDSFVVDDAGNTTAAGALSVGSAAVLGGTSGINGSIALVSQGGNAITLQAPSSNLTAYSLTLPTAAPGANQCLTGGTTGTPNVLQFQNCSLTASTLQTAYDASTGGTTPEIVLGTAQRGVDIQDASSTLGATESLFSVRGSAVSGLGASLFTVNASGKVGIENGSASTTPTISYDLSFGQGADRTIGVEAQATANTTGNSLTISAGAGNGSGAGGALNLQGGTGATIGAVNIGSVGNSNAASNIHIADTTGTGNQAVNIGSAASNTNNLTIIQGGSNTTQAIQLLPNIAGGILIGNASGTGTITVGQSTQTSTINIGNNTIADTKTETINVGTNATATGKTVVAIGSTNGASSLTLQGGSGGVSLLSNGGLTNIGAVGSAALASNVHIADTTDATTTQAVTIGSAASNTNNLTIIQGGSNTTQAIQLLPNTAGGILIGNALGTGAITLGQSTQTSTINIGNATVADTKVETINIGTSATATGKTVVSIGSTNGASSLALQAGSGNLSLQAVGGAINVGATGSTALASNVHIADTTDATTTQAVTIGSAANNTGDVTIIQGGSNTTSAIQLLPNTAGGILIGNATGTGTITLGQSTQNNTVNIGNGIIADTKTETVNIATNATLTGKTAVTIGSTNGASSLLLQAGSGNLSLQAAGGAINVGSVGSSNNASTVHIADTTGTGNQAVTIGSAANNASDTTLIQGGSGATAIQLIPNAAGGILIGNANGTGTITVGQSTQTSTINLGNATVADTQTETINIGTSATATGKTVVSIGSTNGASSLLLQGGSGGITLNGSTTVNNALTAKAGITVGVPSTTTGQLTFAGTTGTNTVSLQAPTSGIGFNNSIILTLPNSLPGAGAVFCLKSDSSGTLSFQNCLGSSTSGGGLAAIANKDSGGVPSNAIQTSASFAVQGIDYTSGNILKEGPTPTSLTGSPVDLLQFQNNSGTVLSSVSATGQFLRIDGATTSLYSTGTISQDGTVITGYGTAFTSNLSNSALLYNDNTASFINYDAVGTLTPGSATQLTSSVPKFSPVYNTGTIAQSGTCTITGTGTTFTSSMNNNVLVYSDGTTAIVTYVSATQLTSSNCSKTVSAGSTFYIYPSDFAYSAGTITQSGTCTITGTGTTFTPAMSGDVIVYNDNTTATVTYVSATQLTSSNCSKVVTGATYYLYQPTSEYPKGILFTAGAISQSATCTITGTNTHFTSDATGDTLVYSDGSTATVTYVSATQLTSSNCTKTVTNAGYTVGPSYTISQSYPGALTIGNSNAKTAADGINLGGDSQLYRSGNGTFNLQSSSNVNGFSSVQTVTIQAGQLQGGNQPLVGTELHIAGGDGTGSAAGGSIVLQVYAPASSTPNYSFVNANSSVQNGMVADSKFLWFSSGSNLSRIDISTGLIQTTKEMATPWKPSGSNASISTMADCNGALYFANKNQPIIGRMAFNTTTGAQVGSTTNALVTSGDSTGITSLSCEVINGTTYLFWADQNDGKIGYVPIDSAGNPGTAVNSFISPTLNLGSDMAQIAVNPNSGSFLYIAAGGQTKTIVRANISCIISSSSCQQSGGHPIATPDSSYQVAISLSPSGMSVNDFNLYWTIQQSNQLCTAPLTGTNNICNAVGTAGTMPANFKPSNIYATNTFLYFGSFTNPVIAQIPIGGTNPNATSDVLKLNGQNGAATFQNASDSTTGFQILGSQLYRGGIPLLTGDTLNSSISTLGQLSVQGGITLSSFGTMSGNTPTVTSGCSGGTCTNTYSYVVTAVNAGGGQTAPSATGTVSSANLATSPNVIKWNPVSGAASYNVYRTATDASGTYPTGLVANILAQEISSAGKYSFSDTIDSTVMISTNGPSSVDTSGQLTAKGTALFQNAANSTTSFQVQNLAGASILDVDTSNSRIGIGTNAPTASLDVRQIANGNDAVVVRRATDTSPTGNFLRFQNALGTDLVTIDISGNLTVKSATVNGTLTVNGHIITGDAAVGTITNDPHVGSGGTGCAISGNQTAGTITLVTGTTGRGSGVICTAVISFTASPHPVVSGADPNAAALAPYISASTTLLTFGLGVSPAATTTYTFNYFNPQ